MEPTNTTPNNNSDTPSHQATASQGKKVGIGIAIIAILALIGITVASNKKTADQAIPVDTTSTSSASMLPADSSQSTSGPSSAGATAGQTSTATFKDGTYTATGSYISPGGPDKVGVTVTLKNDIITDATVVPMPGDSTSAHYQGIFAANYKQYVVGMDISTLNVHKVSGSSLTSKGFNDAITQIEAQAKA